LAYLARLCQLEQGFAARSQAGKVQRAREIERDFLAAHLVPWVPELRTQIESRTSRGWFVGLARLVVEFTARDLATLEEALGPSAGKSVPDYPPVTTVDFEPGVTPP
jgi:TorA maturation chaperone TorD